MKRSAILFLASLLALGACGVDGAPERPTPPTGVSVSGEGRIGVRAENL